MATPERRDCYPGHGLPRKVSSKGKGTPLRPRWSWPAAWLLLACGAGALCAGLPAPQPPQHAPARTVTIPIPNGDPPFYCWEPHLAADPENPDRVLLGAIFGGTVGKGDQARADMHLLVWRSADGGRSWSDPVAALSDSPPPPGRIGADPVVAFGPEKTCWFAGLDYDFPAPTPGYHSLKVCRWDDGANQWTPPLKATELGNDRRGQGIIDKPWLAVDRGAGKRRGTVYVAWTRFDFAAGTAALWCASLPPGGRQFSPGVPLGDPIDLKAGPDLVHHVQLAVRTDGTLDAVWRVAPSGRLVHACSQDGGKTFSKPAAIGEGEKRGPGRFPSLAAAPGGNLLVAWEHRGDVFWSASAAGHWSAPHLAAGTLPEGDRLSHPAVAATADALWILAYRWDRKPARVRVILYRSTDQGKQWEEHCTLASRVLPDGGAGRFSPGDYVGLAAAKGRVYAAYVLPGEGPEGPRPRLYVSALAMKDTR